MEPLPPVKEVEYRCIIGKLFDELAGMEFTTFSFETAKEFSNFRYEIAVRYRVSEGRLEFRVLGMTATRTMMPAFGTARSILKLPHLPLGLYTVVMIKSDGTENSFTIEFAKKGFQILTPIPRKRFIDLVIEPSAQMSGARTVSTISKTPPAPLVPRTIQKRQPPPPTAEELAILESLKSETPEERDAREERELFGEGRAKKERVAPVLKKAAKPAKAEKHLKPAKVASHKAASKPAAKKAQPKKSVAAKPKKSAAKPAAKKASHTPAKKASKSSAKGAARKPAKAVPKHPKPKKPAAKKAAKKR